MRPNFAASPDAIYNDALVEVKCPFVLKTTKPNDLSQLNPDQKRAHCRDVTLKLKKEHDYYTEGFFIYSFYVRKNTTYLRYVIRKTKGIVPK